MVVQRLAGTVGPCRLNSDPGTEGERLATAYENVLNVVRALSELSAYCRLLEAWHTRRPPKIIYDHSIAFTYLPP